MIPIQEIRICFACPVTGVTNLATQIKRIYDGNAVIFCGACQGKHVVRLLNDSTAKRWSLALAIESLEAAHGRIRSFDSLKEKEKKLCN